MMIERLDHLVAYRYSLSNRHYKRVFIEDIIKVFVDESWVLSETNLYILEAEIGEDTSSTRRLYAWSKKALANILPLVVRIELMDEVFVVK